MPSIETLEIDAALAGKKYFIFRPWVIWSASALFVLFQFMLQLSGGVIVEDLMQSFTINALGAGILSSTYYYIYVAFQTPAGILIDKYGPRKLLASGALVCALGCWLFAVSSHLLVAEIGRTLMGAGSSFAFVGSMYLITQWFCVEKFAMMVGIAETVGIFGTLLGNIFLAVLLGKFGWRSFMLGATCVALIIAVLCWVIVRDQPDKVLETPVIIPDQPFFLHTLDLLKNPQAWINGIYSGLQFSIVTVFIALWGIPFFVKVHHWTLTVATIVSSVLFVGLVVGCPLVGKLSNEFSSRRSFLALCALLGSICLSILILDTHLSMISTCILLFIMGLQCSSYVLNFAIARELAPPQATSTSIGFTNMLSVITAPLLQPVVGGLLQFVHTASSPKGLGVQVYNVFDFQVALMILPLALVIAAILAMFIE